MRDMTLNLDAQEPDVQILLRNLIKFVRLLRDLGLNVSPEQSIDFVRGLTLVDIGRRSDVYSTARCILVRRSDDLPLFDLAFALFWRAPHSPTKGHDLPGQDNKPPNPSRTGVPPRDPLERPSSGERHQQVPQLPNWLGQGVGHHQLSDELDALRPSGESVDDLDTGQEEDNTRSGFSYSPVEQIWHKDFAEFTENEIHEAAQLLTALDWKIPLRPSWRMVPGLKGRQLDSRRTIRQSVRYGGEFVKMSWQTSKQKQRPLVIVSDISGSMEHYTKLILRFMHIAQNGLDHTEVFVFSTRLTRITRELAHRRVDEAINQVSKRVSDWSGGTRIGQALHTFNRLWARRVLGHGTIVVIISDGWDRGDLDLLRKEMAHLQRRCYRLVWMNPLLGHPEYVPRSAGMLTALPYIDDFLSAYNLASLRAFIRRLSQIYAHRPVRRQGQPATEPV